MLLSSSAKKLLLTSPSWCYPRYCSHRRRLPLPLANPQDEDSVSGDSEGYYSEEELESFIETDAQVHPRQAKCSAETSPPKRGIGAPKRLKKHRRKAREDRREEDSTPSRPLAASIHANRQQQRRDHHPMSGKSVSKHRGTRTSSRAKKGDQVPMVGNSDQEPSEQEKENQQLQMKLHRLQVRMKLDRQPKVNGKKKSSQKTAMEIVTARETKQGLWKVCKFIKNEKKLYKASKYVMQKLDLQDHQGLSPKEKMEAEETWLADNKDTVRKALNAQRNYVQQELREAIEEIFANKQEHTIPNVEQMMDLVMRNRLDEDTPEEERKQHQELFDVYWNLLVPKVAGHFAWGPGKRHQVLMSTGTLAQGDPDAPPAVTAEDEAFLATLWHNCYNKWWYREKCNRNGTKKDPKEEDRLTPFTEAKGGQKKFGGWKPEAIRFYEIKRLEISENRKTQAAYIAEVEKAALARIRELEGCDEKDAKRRRRKRRSSSLMEVEDSDSEDDENFEKW